MPMLLGTKGNDLLQWRACAELAATLKGELAQKQSRSSAGDCEAFLNTYLEALQAELDHESRFRQDTEALFAAVRSAHTAGELVPLAQGFQRQVYAHFQARQSVLALCSACNDLHDALVGQALRLAAEAMERSGEGDAPLYALLVSGPRGRGEETLLGENRYFLVHGGEDRAASFAAHLKSALLETGALRDGSELWHCTLRDWCGGSPEASGSVRDPLAPSPMPEPDALPAAALQLQMLADLRLVQGDAVLAREALAQAAQVMESRRTGVSFMQLVRHVVGLPLAIGHFGRWRLERGGAHEGELNLEELALTPLVATVRILALYEGIRAPGTRERIEALPARGALDVELAERVLKAYQCFMQLKIGYQIAHGESGSFHAPDALEEGEMGRLRGSLATLAHLQKIAYQRLIGQG